MLSSHQFGFLSNRSCLLNLLISHSEIFQSLDNSHIIDAVYLDFSKAFDTLVLSHSRLLFKLWRFGITGQLWYWFQAYLTNRHHYVQIENVHSSLLPVLSGVTQGSVLGPLLFLIYINDLPTSVNHSSIYLFADDTNLKMLLDVIQSNSCNLQSDVQSVSN